MTVLVTGVIALTAFTAHADDRFKPVNYGDLKERLLVKATAGHIASLVRDPTFIVTRAPYSPELAFKKEILPYENEQLFRVVYKQESEDYEYTMGGKDLKSSGFKVYQLTLMPVDANLRPMGETFEVATKAKPGDSVKEFTGFLDEKVVNLSSVMYREVQVNDFLLNVIDVKTPQGTILANSKARVVKVVKTPQFLSFAKGRDLTVRVTPCTPELQRTNCEAVIQSVGYQRDGTWAHWQNPANRRTFKIFGLESHY